MSSLLLLMSMDFAHFTPGTALAGGLLIGLAAAVLVLSMGRIAGISGILGGLLQRPCGDAAWRVAFLGGLVGAPILAGALGHAVVPDITAGWGEVLIAGFLVGIGTRYAGGCTSGHGVCGISRGSKRSIVATMTFMAVAIAVVYARRALGWP